MSEIIADGLPINITYYPDGSPRITLKNSPFIRRINNIVIRPKSLSSFSAAIFFLGALRERNIIVDRLSIPYILGSRQDRLTNGEESDFLFTAKSVCEMINRLSIKVEIFDPHSDVISGLLSAPIIKNVWDILSQCSSVDLDIKKYDGIISPDAGAEKKIQKIAKKFKINQIVYAYKSRNEETGIIDRVSILRAKNEILGGKYLVIDDICDGGSTFIQLADEIKERGAEADLYVTHGIFSKGTEELLKHYNKIICTDSIIGEKPGVTVLKFFDK